MIVLLYILSVFPQDSIIYQYKDSVVGKTIIEGNFHYYYNSRDSLTFTTEKLENVWYYYRADTIYQKIEFFPTGRTTSWLEAGQWIPGIQVTYYFTPTSYSIPDQQNIYIHSENKRVEIRANTLIKSIEIYDISGNKIKALKPYSNRAVLQFSSIQMIIIKVNNKSFKVLTK